jgi:hypothetical protein
MTKGNAARKCLCTNLPADMVAQGEQHQAAQKDKISKMRCERDEPNVSFGEAFA